MKKAIYLFPILLLISCSDEPSPGQMYRKSLYENVSAIRYFQDKETGICFAERGLGDSYTFTQVDCTPQVMQKTGQDVIYSDGKIVLSHSLHVRKQDQQAVINTFNKKGIKIEFINDSLVLENPEK